MHAETAVETVNETQADVIMHEMGTGRRIGDVPEKQWPLWLAGTYGVSTGEAVCGEGLAVYQSSHIGSCWQRTRTRDVGGNPDPQNRSGRAMIPIQRSQGQKVGRLKHLAKKLNAVRGSNKSSIRVSRSLQAPARALRLKRRL